MKNEMFEEYFLKYKNLVIRIVMNKTNDYQAAQEICQQVFVSLYMNMDKVSPDLVKAWLMRCTQNAVIDHIRANKIKRTMFTDVSLIENGSTLVQEFLDVQEERMDNQELAGRILREVKEANEQWYQMLVLHCVEGMPYSEVARVLHLPVPVLRARMYRARIFVRDKFGNEYRKR